MPSFHLHPGFCGYGVEYSPWGGDRMAVCAAENFGVKGTGKIYILNNAGGGPLQLETMAATEDGVFDIAWSETSPNHLVAACGDGVVKVFNLQTCGEASMPELVLRHGRGEVYSANWNTISKTFFITSSWGREVRIWNPANGSCVMTYTEHQKEVYNAVWNPKNNDLFASCSGDGTFKLWDARRPTSLITHAGHNGEIILSCDWNKYDANVLVTSGVDRVVRMWDVRKVQQPLLALRGHQSAVRRVKCSPHSRNLILSAGYDFQLCLFDTDRRQPLAQRYVQHKEFVVGCDWSLEHPGVVTSTGWDSLVFVWELGKPVVATHGAQPPLPPCLPPPRPPGALGPP
ncbi:Peroxisome biogenesis protein 7 [Diplonema papillatum]|nr:Peroxisome biogenesis protein 7 [Diplonema papillatum]|eukprot:gene3584-5561_t